MGEVMKRYRVELRLEAARDVEIEVEAENEVEAEATARDMVGNEDFDDWDDISLREIAEIVESRNVREPHDG